MPRFRCQSRSFSDMPDMHFLERGHRLKLAAQETVFKTSGECKHNKFTPKILLV